MGSAGYPLISIRRIEDVVVALSLLVEAGFCECRGDGKEAWQEKGEGDPYGELPKIGTTNGLSLLIDSRSRQAVNPGTVGRAGMPLGQEAVDTLARKVFRPL